MKRTFGALLTAGVLVTILAGTASAAQTQHVGATSFVTTACIDPQDEMVFRVDWANQTIDQSQLLTVTWTLDGRGLPSSQVVAVYSPAFDATSWADTTSTVLVGANGPIDWNSWRTIEAAASGAFNATAKVLHRPGHGWPAC
jgi:hypothetical protein